MERLKKRYVNCGKSGAKSFSGVALPAKYRIPIQHTPSSLRYCGSALNEQFSDMCFLRGRVFDKEEIVGGLYSLMDICMEEPLHDSIHAYHRLREGFVNRYGNGREYLGEKYEKSVILIEKRSGGILQGRHFPLPQECGDEIAKWQEGYVTLDEDVEAGNPKRVDYQLSLTDENGGDVASVPFELLTGYACNSGWLVYGNKSKSVVWFVTPFVGARAKSYRKWISVELPKDDVAKIAKASIGLAE